MNSRSVLIMVLLNTIFTAQALASEPYCLALRGNGESEPAHWGALANLVEKAGLPQMQAGGSSAAISLFLLDNIAANPWVKNAVTPAEQNSRAAFLLKSLYGIGIYLGQTRGARSAIDLINLYKSTAQMTETGRSELLLGLANGSLKLSTLSGKRDEVLQLINDLQELGIGDTPPYSDLITLIASDKNPTPQQLKMIRFYSQDLYDAIRTLGAFDAESDANLFFRKGVVNFSTFAQKVGEIATFLSGQAWDQATENSFTKFTQLCEPLHAGLTWEALLQQQPLCQQYLSDTLNAFFAQNLDWQKINVVRQQVGTHIPSFPSTSVVTGSAYNQASKAYRNYHRFLDHSVAQTFSISVPDDVRFGYWGPSGGKLALTELKLAELFPDDAKSRKFLSLGSTSWLEVLSLSPAEPGLASFQPMMVDKMPALSAGGWSDLHPVLILKAAGCEHVVYVTRKGGDALFGQGVAKRLLNLDRSWSKLSTHSPAQLQQNEIINNSGDASDMTSLWSRLYNAANPKSSFMRSVVNADAVLCTDWDAYDVKSQLPQLVSQSYTSPYVITKQNEFTKALLSSGAQPVANPEATDEKSGTPLWAGCRPPN